jgi:hypothetical protein
VKWEGKFHKNGRWSYTEGGVALKEGIVIVHKRSTHYNFDHENWAHIIVDNKEVDENYIMGRIEETHQKPQLSNSGQKIMGDLGLNVNEVWGKIVDAVVEYYRKKHPEEVNGMLKKWEEMEKFL